MITEKMDLVTHIVALDTLHERHTANNMSEAIKRIFKRLKLNTHRMICISVDAARIQVKMSEVLDVDNARCTAHGLKNSAM